MPPSGRRHPSAPSLSSLPSIEPDPEDPSLSPATQKALEGLRIIDKELAVLRDRLEDDDELCRVSGALLTTGEDYAFARDHVHLEIEDYTRYRAVVRAHTSGKGAVLLARLEYYEFRKMRFERELRHKNLRDSYRAFFKQMLDESKTYISVLKKGVASRNRG